MQQGEKLVIGMFANDIRWPSPVDKRAARIFTKPYFFQGRYCSSECQNEDWEQHRGFCKERHEKRRKGKEKKSKKGGVGEGGEGNEGDGGGEGDGGDEGDRGGEGGGERQNEEEEAERCRIKMKALAFSEVD